MFYLSAGRYLENMDLDISEDLRDEFCARLKAAGVKGELTKTLNEYVPANEKESLALFGDDLPGRFVFNLN